MVLRKFLRENFEIHVLDSFREKLLHTKEQNEVIKIEFRYTYNKDLRFTLHWKCQLGKWNELSMPLT